MTRATTKGPIIVAYDFSELAQRALVQALKLAGGDVELHVLCVGAIQGDLLKLPDHPPMTQAEAAETVRAAVAQEVDAFTEEFGSPAVDRIAVYASEGQPADQIVALADEIDADLIVMGTHGRTGLERIMLGSVAEAVTRRAPCGVFIIRPRDFLRGEKLPEVQPPPGPGEPTLRHFRPRAVYHYTSRLQQEPHRTYPVT